MRSPSLPQIFLPALLACALPAVAQIPAPAATQLGQTLELSTGAQQLLQIGSGASRIAIGDPAVLDVKVLRERPAGKDSQGAPPTELLLTPKAAGQTTLTVWPATSGPPRHWQVSVRGPRLLLERRLASVPAHAYALSEARLSLPQDAVVDDRSQIEVISNTVQVDVQVVEFKKSAIRRAGMNLQSGGPNNHGFQFGMFTPGSGIGGGGGGGSSDGDSDTSAISSAMNLVLGFGRAFSGRGISAQLGFLEGNGLARVLAKPTLVAHTGQTASFLAGGEIPIPVPSSSSNNISIQYKEFGVKLQLTPTILSNERIALKVAPEASDLDFTKGVTINGVTVPALLTRRADTMVELADGESFVIGGLVSRTTMSSVNKVPFLGDLPILGTFFKNLNYSQEETELVIIVTPHLVHPLPAGSDLQAVLPGERNELSNAGGVWGSYSLGVTYPKSALPGFSY